jgi:hypothetical protein
MVKHRAFTKIISVTVGPNDPGGVSTSRWLNSESVRFYNTIGNTLIYRLYLSGASILSLVSRRRRSASTDTLCVCVCVCVWVCGCGCDICVYRRGVEACTHGHAVYTHILYVYIGVEPRIHGRAGRGGG